MMSVVDSRNVKIELHRTGKDPFWTAIEEEFRDDPLKWKYLAMLALRENCGWTLDNISKAFQHPKGHVSRCLRKIKRSIVQRFDQADLDGSKIVWGDD